METLSFVFANRATVPTFLGLDVQGEIIEQLLAFNADKFLIVTDETVDEAHGDYFAPICTQSDQGSPCEVPCAEKIVLPCGDAAKSWENLTKLVEWSFAVGATKQTVVVAFGGGALLNVAGLFASIVYRGMKLVYVPTTFLAMHDVVTSLKTSICFDGRKNNIGSFYAPLKILIDVGFCRTLPRSELFSGLGELAKNAALFGGAHLEGFTNALSKDSVDAQNGGSGEEFSLDDDTMLQLVRLGIKAKMDMLQDDALEKTSAMVFEYGHTMSHAIEKTYGDGVIPHGLGVTYGMLACSFVAEKLGIMNEKAREEHDVVCDLLVERWPLPLPLPSIDEVMSRAMKDSKRGVTAEAEDEISDVLLHRVGDVLTTSSSNLSKFPSELFAEWLASMGFPAKAKAVKETLAVLQPTDVPRPWVRSRAGPGGTA
jgi:3-dehydroquinate synthase/2-deoxy-scyllo-inosose synthase